MFLCGLYDDHFAVGKKAFMKVFEYYVSHLVWEGLRRAEADGDLHPIRFSQQLFLLSFFLFHEM